MGMLLTSDLNPQSPHLCVYVSKQRVDQVVGDAPLTARLASVAVLGLSVIAWFFV